MLALMTATHLALAPHPSSRRAVMHAVTQSCAAVFAAAAPPALAFENGVSDMALYAGTAKKPGTPPPDLGLRDRTLPSSRSAQGVLRACDAAPNCFSTAAEGDEEHSLPVWRPPSPDTALAELLDAVKSYSPGQSGIDGGGFKVIRSTPTYAYVAFESLRYGFVDDVEFALGGPAGPGTVQVRSASRLGFLDLGVNAKRLNYLAAKLRAKGWAAPSISPATHPVYFGYKQNKQ
jgi:uncharacterized protein (DUF1499 family)